MLRTALGCVLLAASLFAATGVRAAGGSFTLSEAERSAVRHGLDLIHACQTDDGMIRMRAGTEQVWTVPYFANFAGMALLAAHALDPSPGDVARVGRWLRWYAEHQEDDGTICDYTGTLASYASSGTMDASDSYAATFLMLLRRHREATTGELPGALAAGGLKAFAAIEAVTQADGLTLAKPDYPIKYMIDNIEVYHGLVEGVLLFDALGHVDEAERARAMAQRIAVVLPGYWSDSEGCYAYALDMKGEYTAGLAKPYPDALAQLFALAHLRSAPPELWVRVCGTFVPDADAVPVERWLLAASRHGDAASIAAYRAATRRALDAFTTDNVYVHRPALCILALIDGSVRFPDIPLVPSSRPRQGSKP